MVKSKMLQECPCGSGAAFEQCCEPYLLGTSTAPNALALMRSRYTAYTLADEAYLQKTWHVSTRPTLISQQMGPMKWLGLEIIVYHQEQHFATVEFITQYKINGRAGKLHEKSQFVFEDGNWLYLDAACFENDSDDHDLISFG